MRIAAFFYQDQPHVGLVSQDLTSVSPFDLPLADRELGALTLVDTLSRGEALPAQGDAIALKDVQLRAPLPHPPPGGLASSWKGLAQFFGCSEGPYQRSSRAQVKILPTRRADGRDLAKL